MPHLFYVVVTRHVSEDLVVPIEAATLTEAKRRAVAYAQTATRGRTLRQEHWHTRYASVMQEPLRALDYKNLIIALALLLGIDPESFGLFGVPARKLDAAVLRPLYERLREQWLATLPAPSESDGHAAPLR